MEYLHQLFGILLHRRYLFSPTYQFILYFIYEFGLMDIYSYSGLPCILLNLLLKLFQLWALVALSFDTWVPLTSLPLLWIFCLSISYLWHYKVLWVHLAFPSLVLESAFYSKEPGSFCWRIVLKTKGWALVVLSYYWEFVTSRPFYLKERGNMCY